jgi:undecaprenyl-diphosphatase
MSDLLTIILLGIVEGITEFLPVSSTGHLILAGSLLHYDAARWEVFNIVIQLGAIMAIVVLYWRTFWGVLQGLFRRDAASWRFVRNLLIAFLPAAVLGIILHKKIEALLLSPVTVAVALIVGGFAILGVERVAKPRHTHGVADLSIGTVLGIGFLQCLAMIPGVSRSGATIMGALALGVDRRTAAEFSFFLAVPTMFGASAVQLFTHRHELASGAQVGLGAIALGSVIAFVVALVVVRWFIGIVSRRGFGPFAWYRIGAGAAALVWLLTVAR